MPLKIIEIYLVFLEIICLGKWAITWLIARDILALWLK
jgi:hypothetical protein